MPRLRPAHSIAALALAALAGCANVERFPPACPALALLPDAADLTRFAHGGHDITDMVVDARITAIPATCSQSKPDTVSASLRVDMAVQRGPAATDSQIALPYFVAVMDGDRVLDKQDYALVAAFASNASQTRQSSDSIDMILPVTKAKSAAAYQIFVGYALTPEELALNRARGPR